MSRRDGQSLVEFALILPIFMLVILGIVDVGRMVYAYNAVANSAREAGRTAIINQTPATIRSKASQQATGLSLPTSDPGTCPAAGGPPSNPNAIGTCVVFRSADTTAVCDPTNIGCNAIVTVTWKWQPITPIIGNLIGAIRLASTTTQEIESACPRAGVSVCPDR